MTVETRLDAVYAPSPDVVARDIEGELILVPLVAGIGDLDDDLFTLNESGRAIWERLDGATPLRALCGALAKEFDGAAATIERDTLGLMTELLRRKMVVESGAETP